MSSNVLGQVCSFGRGDNQTALSSPLVTIGQYLDLNNTAPCDGIVQSIRYCTFESIIGNFSVGIWRPTGNNYTMLKEYILSTPPVMSESANDIVCQQMMVTVNQSIQVATGDIIGLYIESADLDVITSSFNESSSSIGGLYSDTRTVSETRDSTTIQSGDLIFNSSLQYNIQIEIGESIYHF